MRVQWLGGPGDGDWVEVPDEATTFECVPQDGNGVTCSVPIKTAVTEMNDGTKKSKLILDYYDKVENESTDS